jgi:TonB family protein
MHATPDTRLELYLQEPHNSSRATPLAVSLTIHAVLAAGLLLLHFGTAPAVIPWRSQGVILTPILSRPPVKERAPKFARPKNVVPPVPLPMRAEARAFHAPVSERAAEPVVHAVDVAPVAPAVATPIAISLPAPAPHLPVLPAPPMKTDNLSSSSAANAAAPAGKVEASGFGTAGVAAHAAPMNGPSVGAFGATSVGTRAAADSPRMSPEGAFGDASAMAYRAKSDAPRSSADTAVEILEKPKPKYTDEARRLGIEGEVLVEALFPASGPARVLRLIRGLGHGLDENAQVAAQSIHFRPATRAGQPVDSTAVVHIVFQIAF